MPLGFLHPSPKDSRDLITSRYFISGRAVHDAVVSFLTINGRLRRNLSLKNILTIVPLIPAVVVESASKRNEAIEILRHLKFQVGRANLRVFLGFEDKSTLLCVFSSVTCGE